jgi:hypothetical protein
MRDGHAFAGARGDVVMQSVQVPTGILSFASTGAVHSTPQRRLRSGDSCKYFLSAVFRS